MPSPNPVICFCPPDPVRSEFFFLFLGMSRRGGRGFRWCCLGGGVHNPAVVVSSGGFMIGTKEGLNKEDLGLKLKLKGEFTLSYSN